jgi:hypothetical protein
MSCQHPHFSQRLSATAPRFSTAALAIGSINNSQKMPFFRPHPNARPPALHPAIFSSGTISANNSACEDRLHFA